MVPVECVKMVPQTGLRDADGSVHEDGPVHRVCKQVPVTRTICEPVTVCRKVVETKNVCVPRTVCRQVPVEVCVQVPVTVHCPAAAMPSPQCALPSSQSVLATPQKAMPVTAVPTCGPCNKKAHSLLGLGNKRRLFF